MWTRKAIVYVGLGVILVLFAPFINNLQLFLLGTTILAFVAVHSLVNTRPRTFCENYKFITFFPNDCTLNISDSVTNIVSFWSSPSVSFLEQSLLLKYK